MQMLRVQLCTPTHQLSLIKEIKFISDSGATEHFMKCDKYFIKKTDLSPPRHIGCANTDKLADIFAGSKRDISVLGENNVHCGR